MLSIGAPPVPGSRSSVGGSHSMPARSTFLKMRLAWATASRCTSLSHARNSPDFSHARLTLACKLGSDCTLADRPPLSNGIVTLFRTPLDVLVDVAFLIWSVGASTPCSSCSQACLGPSLSSIGLITQGCLLYSHVCAQMGLPCRMQPGFFRSQFIFELSVHPLVVDASGCRKTGSQLYPLTDAGD